MKGAPVPRWRGQPYRILFPLGLALSWAGTLHWLLHAAGLLANYRPVFHAIGQVQGFMTCFMLGFLLTAIPRRTETSPPSPLEMSAAVAAPVGATLAAWFGWLAVSQLAWIFGMAVLVLFVVRRLGSRSAGRRAPNSFVWIPVSIVMGIAGSVMTAAVGLAGEELLWIHDLGRHLLLQGMFLGLVVGVGGMLLPRITRLESSADAAPGMRDRLARAGHLAGAAALVASFLVESFVSLRGGYALRAALLIVLLVMSARLWRLPAAPGWHRRLVWLSAWMLPAGYILAALFPAQKKAGLHVTFIAGFALMALSVGTHVTLAHGGYRRLVSGRPWQVPLFGALLLAAAGLRMLVDFDQARFYPWLGAAAAAFVAGTLLWASLVLPRIGRDATGDERVPAAGDEGTAR